MSAKMTCPGCQAHMSDVQRAYEDDEPCPHCGLPADAASKVIYARSRAADADLTARYEGAVIRVGRAEGEAARYKRALDRIREAIADLDEGRES